MASQSWGVYQLKTNASKHLAPLFPNILNPTIGKEMIHSIVCNLEFTICQYLKYWLWRVDA